MHNPEWEALGSPPLNKEGVWRGCLSSGRPSLGFLSSTLSPCNIVSDCNSSNKSNHRTELLRVTGCRVPCWPLPTDYFLFIFMMVLRQVLLLSTFCRCGNWGRVGASCPRPQVFSVLEGTARVLNPGSLNAELMLWAILHVAVHITHDVLSNVFAVSWAQWLVKSWGPVTSDLLI